MLSFAATPLGFGTDGIICANGSLPKEYDDDPARRTVFFNHLQQNLSALSNIKRATVASTLPPFGLGLDSVEIEGRPVSPHRQQHDVGDVAVTASYFDLFKIPLLSGQPFSDREKAGSTPVALVNQAFAHEYFADRGAVGQRIRVGSEKEWVTIVGIVGNEKRPTVYEEMKWIVQPVVYRPILQHPPAGFSIAVASPASLETIARGLERSVSLIESHAALGDTETMRSRLAPYLKYPRFRAVLLGAFSFVAVLLAAVGLYGVLSQFVTQRTADIGIRRAIGATGRDLVRLLAWKGGMPAVAGLFIGLAMSLALARYLSSLLYGVTSADPITYGAVLAVFSVAAASAMIVPAVRALRVDPMTALRTE